MFAHAMLLVDNTMKPLYPLCLLAVLLWTACTHADYSRRMAEADRVMDLYPDSALRLLQDISPSDLGEGDRMRHRLLTVEAECRNDIFTADDSLMETLTDYFRQVKNSVMLARVYYNWGMLYGGRQRYDAALVAYKQAIAPAVQAKDWHLLGRVYGNMGYLLQNNGLDVQADSLYHQAERMARLSGDTLLWAETLHRQAIYQMGQGERGYPKAERLLRLSYDMLEDNHRAGVALSFSYLYSHMEIGEKALYYAKEAVRLRQQDTLQLFRAYVVLGDVFYKAAQYDSARYYFLQGMHSEALEVKIGACIRLATIARKLDDWKQVAYYQEQERLYKDVYNEQKQREQIVLAQQGQEFMQWKRLMQKHQIKVYVFVGSFILLIILFIVRFVFRNRRKYEQIRHEMSATLSVHELTQSQVVKTNVVDSGSGNIYTEEIFQYFQIEIRHTDIYKKVERIILFQKNNPGKKGPETFDSDDKTAFINEVDRLLPGYIFRLRSRFVLLDERDILLLCLYLAGFSVPQIGIVFERHRDSIYKYIRRIKKEKMLILDEKDINEILHHVE